MSISTLTSSCLHALETPRTSQRPITPWDVQKQVKNQSIESLKKKALEPSASLSVRWAAVQELAQRQKMGPSHFFVGLLDHPEWYLRNAGLLALSQSFDREQLLKASLKLLDDPALVVRSAAVDQLAILKDSSSWTPLLGALTARNNYHRGQSLWIRPQIAQVLRELARPGHEKTLLSLIDDSDNEVRAALISGLERITKQSFGPIENPQTLKNWVAWGASLSRNQL